MPLTFKSRMDKEESHLYVGFNVKILIDLITIRRIQFEGMSIYMSISHEYFTYMAHQCSLRDRTFLFTRSEIEPRNRW